MTIVGVELATVGPDGASLLLMSNDESVVGKRRWSGVLVAVCLVAVVVVVAVLCWVRVRVGGGDVVWVVVGVVVVALWVAVVVMASRGMSRWPRRLLVAGAVVLSPLLVAAGMFGWLLAEDIGTPAPATPGSDALWLGHAWVDGHRSAADVDALVGRVREAGIRDLYVHVGPLADDGSLDRALRPTAGWLVESLHRAAPGVRIQAWLGDVVAADRLRLDDAATRKRVLDSASQVLVDGFDGVHYDFEPVAEGSPDFLDLLTTTHTLTRAHHAVLSVAANQIEPVPGAHLPGQLLFGRPHWWSAGYFGEVADAVDQIVIMSYDTGIPSEVAYSGYLNVQTRLASQSAPTNVDLLIGIPAYHDGQALHTAAETPAPALRGLRLALSDDQTQHVGAALYLDVTATPDDWDQYFTHWVHASG